jgi:predicted unusual protein kinase regulating ubiquinone biosynthesis (AarF/ABC1/UbiB family)
MVDRLTEGDVAGESVPRVHPRRLPASSRTALARRGAEITGTLARELAPLALRQIRQVRQGPLPPSAAARPLRRSAERLGGTFLKFGQMVASSPGLFGEDVADEFRSCLDTGPPVPFPEVRQRVEDDLGGRRSPWCTAPASTTGGRSRSRSCARGSRRWWPPTST